jgi:hypothetical protein
MGSHMNCLFTLVYDLKHVLKKIGFFIPQRLLGGGFDGHLFAIGLRFEYID